MKTFTAKKQDIQQNWYLIDATNQTLGRLASIIANRLRGKHKAEFTNHVDIGDFIIVTNCEKIKVTGDKENKKIYYSNKGTIGGLKQIVFKDLMKKNPTEILRKAVCGMLPKNALSRNMAKKLKLYTGNMHPHAAQNPAILTVEV